MFKYVNGERVALTETEIQDKKAKDALYIEEKAVYEATVKYKDDRAKEYPSTDALIVAMWESLVEGDDVALNELQAKRLEVKAKHPKPNKE